MKVMKVKVLVAATLAAIAALGTANAADMSTPPLYSAPAPAAYSWTGCYIGGGGGYGWWTQDSFVEFNGVAATVSNTNGGSGWFGQGQGGCDYQFTAPVFNVPAVIGLFGDYEGGQIDGRSSVGGLVGGERESGAWSVGARAGVLLTPRVLTFFDGGTLAAETYNGWFLGSGFEYSFDWLPIHGLFLKTEYRYAQYGGNGVSIPMSGFPAGFGIATLNSQKATEMVSTELVWRFNWH
jgi:outer membrane immunogenic protein